MKFIKTFESFNIKESLNSQENLEKLANLILEDISEYSLKHGIVEIDNVKKLHLENCVFYYFVQKHENLWDNIKDKEFKNFLLYTDLKTIQFKDKVEETPDINAFYQPSEKNVHNSYAIIVLYVSEDFKKELNEEIKKPNFNKKDLYIKLYFKFYKWLIHELQHAYDDYISNGKFVNTKKQNEYDKSYNDFAISNNKDEKDTDIKKSIAYKKYLNLQHEINARFTQTLPDIFFYDFDFDTEKYSKKSFPEVLKDFKSKFKYFRVLKNSDKKRLIHRLYNLWLNNYREPKELKEEKEKTNKN